MKSQVGSKIDLSDYLQQMSRSKITKTNHYYILRGFQSFVAENFPDQPLSRDILQAWLRNRDAVWSRQTIVDKTCFVDRFLDWLVMNGRIPSNPLADLRLAYGSRVTPQIVEALISPDSSNMLESLKRLPRFGSHLGSVMQDHLRRMRSLGYRYESAEHDLSKFDRFLQTRPELDTQPLEVLVREWASLAKTAHQKLRRFYVGRMLSLHLRRIDPAVVPIKVDKRLRRETIRQRRRPYIYSEGEVKQLLTTASQFYSPDAPLRPLTLRTMIVLAYGAGLRAGEVWRLKLGDIDLDEGTIDIRETKFFKSRRLPLTTSVLASLREYLAARAVTGAPTVAEAPLFWNALRRNGYALSTILRLLVTVIRNAGLKPQRGRIGPRLHDLRHSFVVHRMIAWYKAGINPQSRLQYLTTYLGHKDIYSTLVYLTITQDLLQQAGDRYRSLGAKALDACQGGGSCN